MPASILRFLSNSKNKTQLVNFLLKHWSEEYQKRLNQQQKLTLALLNGTTLLVKRESAVITEVITDHEETDSKMFVYAYDLMSKFMVPNIIIKSPDTDVAVLFCYHYFNHLKDVFRVGLKQEQGTKIVLFQSILFVIGSDHRFAIFFQHSSVTGCDSVSSFAGIGKKKAFQVLCKKKEKLESLLIFGDSHDIDEYNRGFKSALMLIIFLYGGTDDDVDIAQLRYKLFSQKSLGGAKLPPTYDAALYHIKRANYQMLIWKNACIPNLNLPSPDGNGWKMLDGEIVSQFMNNKAAPNVILELNVCNCKKL